MQKDSIKTIFKDVKNLKCKPAIAAHEKIYKTYKWVQQKADNHCLAIALHFVYYNFVKIHKTLRVPPAMEEGLIKRLMTVEDIVKLAEPTF